MSKSYYDTFPPAPPRDTEPLRRLIAKRKVLTWCNFPAATKAIYLSIARCYPGVQLHACGSRVKGYYSDLDDKEAQSARMAMGRMKLVSDFDFIAPPGASPATPLPPGADQAAVMPRDGCSIPIPIYNGE